MSNEPSVSIGYGLIISPMDNPLEVELFEKVDSDPLVRYSWRDPKSSGPLSLAFCGDSTKSSMHVSLLVASTRIDSYHMMVKKFVPSDMVVPEGSDDLLLRFCEKYNIDFVKPEWLISVDYG